MTVGSSRCPPTDDAIRNEVVACLEFLRVEDALPVEWKFNLVKVVKRIRDSSRAKVERYENDDSGNTFDITISLVDLAVGLDWQRRVWARVLHELAHLRTAQYREAVDDALAKFEEEAAKTTEAFAAVLMNAFQKRGQAKGPDAALST